jgi:hypothetical protein
MLIFEPQIGQVISLIPVICVDKKGEITRKALPGKIVYINDEHNYFTAEFTFKRGSFRESFKFYRESDFPPQRTINTRVVLPCQRL